ncbi:MAG: tetratricopeptide repeat protein [Kordia sp.]|uniref:tetratricopeptide repeat protein n=1 Tax=Kordia sp. TaxID=1965332 RepID=UPI00385E72FE
MKNTITFLCALFIFNINFAQSNKKVLFKVDKNYYEAVDKWVVYPSEKEDKTVTLGFIYIDRQAGFTLNYEYDIELTLEGLKKGSSLDNTSLKVRLTKDFGKVAILTPQQVKELGLPEQPDWLKIYKKDAKKVSYLTKIGYHYNHVGASKFALTPLLKAYEKEPHFAGLEFELSYAYNAIGEFEKAITILEKAIHNNPNNYFFFRELGFSYKNLKRVEDAERTYKKGISMSDNDFEKSEMAVNMAQTYFELRNRKKFDEWAKLTRKFAKKGARYAKFIDYFESNWDKK